MQGELRRQRKKGSGSQGHARRTGKARGSEEESGGEELVKEKEEIWKIEQAEADEAERVLKEKEQAEAWARANAEREEREAKEKKEREEKEEQLLLLLGYGFATVAPWIWISYGWPVGVQ